MLVIAEKISNKDALCSSRIKHREEMVENVGAVKKRAGLFGIKKEKRLLPIHLRHESGAKASVFYIFFG